jgi:hypothetical protein
MKPRDIVSFVNSCEGSISKIIRNYPIAQSRFSTQWTMVRFRIEDQLHEDIWLKEMTRFEKFCWYMAYLWYVIKEMGKEIGRLFRRK